MGRRIGTLVLTGILGAGVLAACGDDGGAEAPATDETTEEPATDETTAEEPAGDAAAQVATADSDLGTILVDGEGMTLYLFTNDSPGVSVCADDCLEAWPPLVGEPTAGEGVDESLLGSLERDDGTVQATYADWPLYYFAQDAEPGDVTGQGVNDVWFVLSPDGEMVTESPAAGPRMGY